MLSNLLNCSLEQYDALDVRRWLRVNTGNIPWVYLEYFCQPKFKSLLMTCISKLIYERSVWEVFDSGCFFPSALCSYHSPINSFTITSDNVTNFHSYRTNSSRVHRLQTHRYMVTKLHVHILPFSNQRRKQERRRYIKWTSVTPLSLLCVPKVLIGLHWNLSKLSYVSFEGNWARLGSERESAHDLPLSHRLLY